MRLVNIMTAGRVFKAKYVEKTMPESVCTSRLPQRFDKLNDKVTVISHHNAVFYQLRHARKALYSFRLHTNEEADYQIRLFVFLQRFI